MKRIMLAVVAFALLTAACSGATAVENSDAVVVEDADVPSSTSSTAAAESSQEATPPSSETKPPTEGPAAPDFTLALEPSGEFVLSEEVKPVYMIFWAEW